MVKSWHTKMVPAARRANFLKWFLLRLAKGSNKNVLLSILSYYALPERYCEFSFLGSKLTVLEAKRVKIGL
jgi:hypothetical protein